MSKGSYVKGVEEACVYLPTVLAYFGVCTKIALLKSSQALVVASKQEWLDICSPCLDYRWDSAVFAEILRSLKRFSDLEGSIVLGVQRDGVDFFTLPEHGEEDIRYFTDIDRDIAATIDFDKQDFLENFEKEVHQLGDNPEEADRMSFLQKVINPYFKRIFGEHTECCGFQKVGLLPKLRCLQEFMNIYDRYCFQRLDDILKPTPAHDYHEGSFLFLKDGCQGYKEALEGLGQDVAQSKAALMQLQGGSSAPDFIQALENRCVAYKAFYEKEQKPTCGREERGS